MRSAVSILAATVVAGILAGSGSAAAPPAPSLVFASSRSSETAIYSINADGTGLQRLTRTPNPAFESQPTYSPDGSRIAYVCGNFELCVMNADGSGAGRLTTSRWPDSWDYVSHPSWSPDGTKIAFAISGDGNSRIYVINADGSGLRELAGTNGNDENPAWSPNGTTIAFDSYRGGGNSSIYVMSADGMQPQRLTSGTTDDMDPAWSPEGSRIVYNSYDGMDTHLAIMNADGGQKDLITYGFCDEYDPAWSPFGATLAFEENCNGMLGIDVGDFSRVLRITAPKQGFDEYPAWRPIASGPQTSVAPPSLPVSTPTQDTRLVAAYNTWSIRVEVIDYSLDATPSVERMTMADDRHAIADLNGVQAQTSKGQALQRNAVQAFRFDIASSKLYVLSDQADAKGRHRAARTYERAADALAKRAEHKFNVADGIADTPY
jgi:dipeptidyl aminopeptidase/acylaminoacyl peptidase